MQNLSNLPCFSYDYVDVTLLILRSYACPIAAMCVCACVKQEEFYTILKPYSPAFISLYARVITSLSVKAGRCHSLSYIYGISKDIKITEMSSANEA